MSSVYADVIVDITNEKLDRTFQYKVPPELTGEISPGTAVQIPFGNGNRTITGYVLSVGNEPKYPQDRIFPFIETVQTRFGNSFFFTIGRNLIFVKPVSYSFTRL